MPVHFYRFFSANTFIGFYPMRNVFHRDGQTPRRAASQQSRVRLLLLIMIVLVALQGARLGWIWLDEYSQGLDQRMETRSLEFRNLRRLIAESDVYAAQAESLKDFRERLEREHFVKAASPPLSEAMFQNIVNELAGSHEVNVASMRMLPRSEREGVLLLRLGIHARAEIGAIRDFVAAVEQNPRLIFFEELEVKQISRNERRFLQLNASLAAVSEQ